MSRLAKALPAIFLLVQIAWADPLKAPVNELSSRFSPYDEVNYFQKIRSDYKEDFENFFLLSSNFPTKLSFRASTTPNYKYDAFIERLSFSANSRKACSFPAFGYDPATYYVKLQSADNGYEIFQIFKSYKDYASNSIDFYIINMTDCSYTKSEILKGYDYFKYGGSFLVLHPWNKNMFDYFWFNGQNDCGSYICKRIYNFTKQSFGEPTPFVLPNYSPSSKLLFLSSSYDQGYFSLMKTEDKCSLLSLSSSGSLVNIVSKSYNRKLKLIRLSTDHDFFSACYIMEYREKEVECVQLDPKLNYNFNKTINFGYETGYLAIHNLKEGGLLLLSAYCANGDYEKCQEQEFRLSKFDAAGTYSDFSKFSDDSCIPKKRRFTFFEEDGKVCIFYACDAKREKDSSYDYIVRSRCF